MYRRAKSFALNTNFCNHIVLKNIFYKMKSTEGGFPLSVNFFA